MVVYRLLIYQCSINTMQELDCMSKVRVVILTSPKGFIFVCMIKLNLHSSHDLVSEAVSHCWRQLWWTYLRLPADKRELVLLAAAV